VKVLRIIPFLDFGGVEQRIKLTMIGFKNVNTAYEMKTVVLGYGGIISEELNNLKFPVIILNKKVKIPNLVLIYSIVKIFLEEKPQIVHTSGAEANFHGLVAAWLVGTPVRIGEEIGFPNHDWKWRLVFKGIYMLSTKVIAISEAVKSRIVQLGEIRSSKVEVVYNPVSIESVEISKTLEDTQKSIIMENLRFASVERENPSFVFVTTCRLVLVKNLMTLILVFKKLVFNNSDMNLRLWIVGDGSEREFLEKLVRELNISQFVTFWGYQKGVIDFLSKADAFVLPSKSEGFSISLVEAMLAGLPCIVTEVGGPAEIIVPGETGFLINPNQPEALMEKMQTAIFMSDEERSQMGLNAKKAAKIYSVPNYIANLLKVYEKK